MGNNEGNAPGRAKSPGFSALKGRNRSTARPCARFRESVSPFQGEDLRPSVSTRGVAPGCHVTPLRGEASRRYFRSTPENCVFFLMIHRTRSVERSPVQLRFQAVGFVPGVDPEVVHRVMHVPAKPSFPCSARELVQVQAWNDFRHVPLLELRGRAANRRTAYVGWVESSRPTLHRLCASHAITALVRRRC